MEWYEEDVKGAIKERQSCDYDPRTIFYGSSSIRLWNNLYEDFNDYKPVNLGFGGSTLAACVWFFDQIIGPLNHPKTFILYAGDNDLGDGRHPEEVVIFFRQFLVKFREKFPDIPFYYISIKPSLSRIEIINEITKTNRLIEGEINSGTGKEFFVNVYDRMIGKNGKPLASLFESDGLHMNRDGYLVWREVILNECLLGRK